MRAILDTHALLWFLEGDDRLPGRARNLIEDGDNEILISIASLWEIAVKHSLGKLDLARPFDEVIPSQLDGVRFVWDRPHLVGSGRRASLT